MMNIDVEKLDHFVSAAETIRAAILTVNAYTLFQALHSYALLCEPGVRG